MAVLLVISTPLVFAGAIYLGINGDKRWQAFSRARHCKLSAEMSSDVVPSFGVDQKGNPVNGITMLPSKTGYRCDDGVTYWK